MRLFTVFSIMLVLVAAGPSRVAADLKSTKVPRYDVAVAKAVEFLKKEASFGGERDIALCAYALFKAGVKTNDPVVAAGIHAAAGRGASQNYGGYDHIYLAGVDAMLLADVDADQYRNELQRIADYITRAQRADGSWSDTTTAAGDISMSQYGVLGLWAASRAGCNVSPQALDRAAGYFFKGRRGDGGWPYRPGTKLGPGQGTSTYNMTMAGGGCLAIVRSLFYGKRGDKKSKEEMTVKGVLVKDDPTAEKEGPEGTRFPGYNPGAAKGNLDSAVDRALAWNEARFAVVPPQEHKIYFYYCLERASALAELPEGWFTTYGDGLLTLQGEDGSFKTHSGPRVGTAFAILYFVRSTQQILDKEYASGILAGGRGLDALLGDKEKKKELGPLDELLAQMEKADLSALDDIDAEDIAEKITFGSREELVGQKDLLLKLVKSRDAANRQAAYYALGRTGDFSLIPVLLKGIRDVNVDVGRTAIEALRYISRKPNGFGLSLQPFDGVETADEATRLKAANAWRSKAYRTWGNWYRGVRPYSESGGLDELELDAGQR